MRLNVINRDPSLWKCWDVPVIKTFQSVSGHKLLMDKFLHQHPGEPNMTLHDIYHIKPVKIRILEEKTTWLYQSWTRSISPPPLLRSFFLGCKESSTSNMQRACGLGTSPGEPNLVSALNSRQINKIDIKSTLLGTNLSHLGKRKIIFKYAILGGYVTSLEGKKNSIIRRKSSYMTTFFPTKDILWTTHLLLTLSS